uniref:Uncharacterized protein n=1 Tax=Oryza glumipatula TaxID=40148 RepID=A0A0E0AGW0_9ORYZ
MGARRKPTVGLVSSPDAVVEVGISRILLEGEERERWKWKWNRTKGSLIDGPYISALSMKSGQSQQYHLEASCEDIEIKQLSGQNSHVQWA